jgi:acyl-coenzyme A thioesterase PaaI-like protein
MKLPYNNSLHRTVDTVQKLPVGNFLLNLLLGFKIPFVRTGRVKILKMTPDLVKVTVPNVRSVRNHIYQVHAAAMMLLGETASGLVTGMNVSEECLPLLKEMNCKFIKRSTGRLTASAKILSEQKSLFTAKKGEITLLVEVQDDAGETPILIEATWAWIPKKKPDPEIGLSAN